MMTAPDHRYQPSIEDRQAARRRAEAHLRTSCRTIINTSPDVVKAMTLSIPANEFGVPSDDWREIALSLAKDYVLHVDVSMRHGDLTIRFTREDGPEDDRF